MNTSTLRSKRILIPTGLAVLALGAGGEINLEVGVELDSPFAGCGEVVGSATPAGQVAFTTHYGPYGRLDEAHEAIRSWCRNNGHALAGPSWEVYGHWEEEWDRDPSKICTEVCYLVVVDGSSAAAADDRDAG